MVSGPIGRERLQYESPRATRLDHELKIVLQWFNAEDSTVDAVLKAGIAHLWFVTLHPFEDGNGRIARAIDAKGRPRRDSAPGVVYRLP